VRKKRKLTPEERAEWEARSEKTLRMLRERIEYYERRAKTAGADEAASDEPGEAS
jgi:hypothetical protein